MSISPLSESTVRAIGSSLVLNDAASVVKELIDNALDARSTNISIEISANTLDIIQVKDNGTGIGLQDRQFICKRGCTSKIRTISDLEALGGTSLGFRGEALASIVDLSEQTTVTTCVEGEKVGTALKFGPGGRLESFCSKSHPTGTTVRVQDFLKPIPVRKQTAVKSASKTLIAVKKLLQGYAFARPTIRFSVKVLKGKNEKANWLYTGHARSTLLEAAAKIVSKEVASQCEQKTFLEGKENASSGDSVFEIEALLLRNRGDALKTHNPVHFFSIDGRPVRSDRGSMKEISKIYRSYFRNEVTQRNAAKTLTDPFLCMHIRCPVTSYDVNIEPSKDEVLFLDPSKVIEVAEKLFLEFYGPLDTTEEAVEEKHQPISAAKGGTFDVLMAKRTGNAGHEDSGPRSSTLQIRRQEQDGHIENGRMEEPETGSIVSQQYRNELPGMVTDCSYPGGVKAFRSMSPVEEEDLSRFEEPPRTLDSQPDQDDVEELRSARVMNPWSVAKMNAPLPKRPVSPHFPTSSNALAEPVTLNASIPDSSPRPVPVGHPHRPLSRPSLLPTPSVSPHGQTSSHSLSLSLRDSAPVDTVDENEEDIEFTQPSDGTTENRRFSNCLEAWVKPSKPTMQLPSLQKAPKICNEGGRFGESPHSRFEVLPGSVGECAPSPRSPLKTSAIPNSVGTTYHSPDIDGRPQRTTIVTRTPTVLGPPGVGHLRPKPVAEVDDTRRLRLGQPSPSQLSSKMTRSQDDELAQILDFERRKKDAIKQHRHSQLKIGRAFLNPGKLAQMQRYKSVDSANADLEQNDLELTIARDATVSSLTAPFTSRFGASLGKEIGQNNPHHNHFLAATRVLTHAHPEEAEADNNERSEMSGHCEHELEISSPATRMPEDDPRAYFIRRRQSLGAASNGVTKAGPKMRRPETFRLPLETVPAKDGVHDLTAVLPEIFPTAKTLSESYKSLGNVDKYVMSGKNEFITWSAYSAEVQQWEQALRNCVASSYRVRVEQDELVAPQLNISLSRSIKTYIGGSH